MLRGKLHKQSHHLQKIENEASLLSKIKNKAPPQKKTKEKTTLFSSEGVPVLAIGSCMPTRGNRHNEVRRKKFDLREGPEVTVRKTSKTPPQKKNS